MSEERPKYYYGDEVRGLFIMAGVLMVISYPFFSRLVGSSLLFSIIACVAMAVFGGLMNPKQKWVIIFNNIFSILAFIIFEYSATHAYLNFSSTIGLNVAFFWANQALAIIFFFAAYFSTKTLRRFLLKEKFDRDENKSN
jgi:hypothetical protein